MLCPAILDPFEGQNYRIAAFIHQGILCPLLCKIVCFIFAPRNGIIENESASSTLSTKNQVAQLVDLGKERPQSACDSSVLSGGRKLMDGTPSFTTIKSNHHNNGEDTNKKVD